MVSSPPLNQGTRSSMLSFAHLDEDELRLVLFEMSNVGSIRLDPDRLTSLKFNPLLCESFKNFSLCKDSDPDANFYLNSSNCEYCTEDSFNNMLVLMSIRIIRIHLVEIFLFCT